LRKNSDTSSVVEKSGFGTLNRGMGVQWIGIGMGHPVNALSWMDKDRQGSAKGQMKTRSIPSLRPFTGSRISRSPAASPEAQADSSRAEEGLDGRLVVEQRQEGEEGLRGERGEDGTAPGNLEEEVEVVAHEAVGGDAEGAEGLELAEDRAEGLLLRGVEDDALVDDAGDAVVEGSVGDDEAGPHGGGQVRPGFGRSVVRPAKRKMIISLADYLIGDVAGRGGAIGNLR
jgi:hypothetical protein